MKKLWMMGGKLTKNEIWQTIPGLPTCYEVSNYGRIRSYRFKRQKERLTEPVLLKPVKRGMAGRQRNCIQLTLVEGKRQIRWFSIASLVLTAFKGQRPKGYEAAHNDGNSFNDNLKNLRWATSISNANDKIRHGTHIHGSKTKTAKLTEDEVIKIRKLYLKGKVSQRKLANQFGVSQRTIFNIVKNKSWNFVGVD